MTEKIEIIAYHSVQEGQIPVPGTKVALWAGDGEPTLGAVIVEIERQDRRSSYYRFALSTSDKRMIDLNERCPHEVLDDRGKCLSCSIVPRKHRLAERE